MYCTKCGTKNEDNNVFCKNCGAKLVNSVNNSPVSSVPSSQGVSSSTGVAKAVNVKLIAGIAAALVVVVVVGVLTNRNKSEDMNDNSKVTEAMKSDKNEDMNAAEVAVSESIGAETGYIDETPKQLYSVTAEKLGNDIASFQHFTVNGMQSVSDQFSFDRDIKLEDVIAMTSINRSNVSFVDIYTSSPDIIVADSADMKDIDDFITFCGDPYRKIQWDIRKGHNSVSDCYYNVVVQDSNIDGEYKYYDGEAEKVYLKVRFIHDKFVDESWVFEMVQSASDPKKWLINDCWETDKDTEYNLSSYKLHNADDTQKDSYPDWYNAYKEFADKYEVAFVGGNDNGVPYMLKKSDGLYLYNGTGVEKLEIKGLELEGASYSFDTNQLALYGSERKCYMDLATGRVVCCVGDSYSHEENDYFDGDGNVIDYEVYKDQEWRFNSWVPDTEIHEGFGVWRKWIEIDREAEPEGVHFYTADRAFIEYMSECGFKPLKDSAETNMESSENTVDASEWLDAYKNAYARNNDGNQYCFIGQSNTGVPYLAKAWGGLDYYNGSEVVNLCYSQNIEYNPATNKVREFSHTSLPNGGGDNFYLIDLNIGEVELSCAEVTEDWDTGIVKYYGDDGEVSEEEYARISGEMGKRYGDGGNIIETWYNSVDLAYEAYKIKMGSIPASASTSATNASESAGTALAANDSASEYILKDSSSRYLTKDDLQGFSADDCRIARNELYARHGRKFDDEGLQSHFNSCSWYQGTIEPSDFEETMLSDIEIANKNLIVEYEKEMGYRQ